MSSASLPADEDMADDGLPVVAPRKNSTVGPWIFGAILLIGGIGLFTALNANRQTLVAPSTTFSEADPSRRISSPPPLPVPQVFNEREPRRLVTPPATQTPVAVRVQPAPTPPVQSRPIPTYSQPVPVPTALPAQPQIVFDGGAQGTPAAPTAAAAGENRVTAGRFTNPSRTIPQGTVIPAVLETALDSTRPGGVRALVQQDVRGFDGSRILVPRGSRLYGEYEAGLEAGQKRALVRWTRLLRPDGVTIALDSPASDPLGRAGVKGKVDSKFFSRFGSAILQSVLDVGVGLATREVGNGVVVALPGSTQNIAGQSQQQIQSTLTVKHGASVSVFVARDLDFSTVDY